MTHATLHARTYLKKKKKSSTHGWIEWDWRKAIPPESPGCLRGKCKVPWSHNSRELDMETVLSTGVAPVWHCFCPCRPTAIRVHQSLWRTGDRCCECAHHTKTGRTLWRANPGAQKLHESQAGAWEGESCKHSRIYKDFKNAPPTKAS